MDNFFSNHPYTISTPDQVVTPGMICTSIYFIAMALTSESFITERSQGLLERSWVAGVLPSEIIASYIMSQFFVMVIQVNTSLMIRQIGHRDKLATRQWPKSKVQSKSNKFVSPILVSELDWVSSVVILFSHLKCQSM